MRTETHNPGWPDVSLPTKADNKKMKELKERLFEDTSYLDVFALSMARTESTLFKTDIGLWNEFFFSVTEEFETTAPEIFDEIIFDITNTNSPWSSQVGGFLTSMLGSGSLNRWTTVGAASIFEMPDNAKKSIEEGQQKPLEDHNEMIAAIAKKFDDNLGIK